MWTRKIDEREIRHIRSHAELDNFVDEFSEMTRKAGGRVPVGLDTEGSVGEHRDPATVQISIAVAERKLDAVIQLFSRRNTDEPAHVFMEGPPTQFAEIFLALVVFVGKSIAYDVTPCSGSARSSRVHRNSIPSIQFKSKKETLGWNGMESVM